MEMCNSWDHAEIIHQYTRANALEDGELIDVSKMARDAGFKVPVAIARSVWDTYIVPSPKATCQSIEGRLWDTLWMAVNAARQVQGDTLLFTVIFIMKAAQRRYIKLKSVIGPGDNGEPVITIMLPEED